MRMQRNYFRHYKITHGNRLNELHSNQIRNLIALYFKNPSEIFQLIQNRKYLLLIENGKVIGFLTFEEYESTLNNQVINLGFICTQFDRKFLLKEFLFEFIKKLKGDEEKKIVIFATTKFHVIAKTFYHFFRQTNWSEVKVESEIIMKKRGIEIDFDTLIVSGYRGVGEYKESYIKSNYVTNKGTKFENLIGEQRYLLIGSI